VVLWQNFGEQILDFDQVMRMGKIRTYCSWAPADLDRADCPPPLRGRSAWPRQRCPCLVASRLGFHSHL
jgi:hypothetical protein